MNVGSLFSGVGGIDLGLERAGWRVVFQCESDPWCRGILAQHWPRVPCYEDVRGVRRAEPHVGQGDADPSWSRGRGFRLPAIDILCGGFPCQDLSVAGQRAGLSGGERSSLFFEFARIADDLVRPGGWVLIENVPGLLSSHGGRDFAVLLATLADLGFHDLAWRVLDSRYFGVPQRRRRVFIVGRRAVGACAQQVLLEPESGGGDFAPSREARARTSLLAEGGAVQSLDRQAGGADDNSAQAGHLIAHTLRAEGFDASEDGTGRGTPLTVAGALGGGNDGAGRRSEFDPNLVCTPADPDGMRAPSEFPRWVDDPPPDGPRYAALGNAVTVSVAEWLGRRIMTVALRKP